MRAHAHSGAREKSERETVAPPAISLPSFFLAANHGHGHGHGHRHDHGHCECQDHDHDHNQVASGSFGRKVSCVRRLSVS